MIRLRVEWHCECPDCHTQLAFDYLDGSCCQRAMCPWCGRTLEAEPEPDDGLKSDLARAVAELEERANGRTRVGS